MSNKKKQKKTPIWPWILSIFLLILLATTIFAAWFFLGRDTEEQTRPGDNQTESTKTDDGQKGDGQSGSSQPEDHKDYEVYYEPAKDEEIAYDEGNRYIKSHLLLTAQDHVSYDDIKTLVAEDGGEIVGYIELTGDYQINYPQGKTYQELKQLIEKYKNNSMVADVMLEEVFETNSSSINYRTDPWTSAAHPNDGPEGWISEDAQTGTHANDRPSGTNWWAEAICMPAVWAMDQNYEQVEVGLIDSFFDNNNDDLRDTFPSDFIYGQDGIDVALEYETALAQERSQGNKYTGISSGSYAHGTVDAGIIAAKNDDYGIAGISQNARLHGVSLKGNSEKWNDSLMSYKYAIAKLLNDDVKVINISMGSDVMLFSSYMEDHGDDRTSEALDDLHDCHRIMQVFLSKCLAKKDFLITKAAGNTRGNYYKKVKVSDEFPYGYESCDGNEKGALNAPVEAKYDFLAGIEDENVKNHILVVGALDELIEESKEFAWYNITCFSCIGDRVDVYAPGGELYRKGNNDRTKTGSGIYILSDYPNNQLNYMQGTSQAAPMAAGVAALVWGSNPKLSGEDVKNLIIRGAQSYTDFDNNFNYKMLNAFFPVLIGHDQDALENADLENDAIFLGYSYHNITDANGKSDIEKYDFDATLYNENKTVVVNELELDEDKDFSAIVPPGTYTLVIEPDQNHSGIDTYEERITLAANETAFRPIEMTGSRDIVLVLDHSGSMSGNPLEQTKIAANNFVDTVIDNSRVALVTYDDTSTIVSNLTNDADQLRSDIDGTYTGGSTNIYAGLESADQILSGSQSRKRIIVLMSDGLPNEGPTDENGHQGPIISYAEQLKNKGYYIYTLGFFSSISPGKLAGAQNLMQQIASPGLHYEVENAEDLRFGFDDIANQIDGNRFVYIRIECPVYVTVTCNDQVLSSKPENENTRTDFGTLSYEKITTLDEEGNEIEDEAKILRLKMDTDYDIDIEGYDEGSMNYSISYPDDNGEYNDVRSFNNIAVNSSMRAKSNTKEGTTTQLKVDDDGDGNFDHTYKNTANGTMKEEKPEKDYTLLYIAILIFLVLLLFLLVSIYAAIRKYKKKKARLKELEEERQEELMKQLSTGYIIGISGAFADNRYMMNAGMDECSIGRGNTCDIMIDEPKISRVHCTIWLLEDGNYMIVDTSSNGTYINHKRLTSGKKYVYGRGTRICLANTENILELR